MYKRQLHDQLEQISPELAKLYLGAVLLLGDETNPASVYFVAHAAREIANKLPEYLGAPKVVRIDYPKHLSRITSLWLEAFPVPIPDVSNTSSISPTIESAPVRTELTISQALHDLIGQLIRESAATTESYAMRARLMIQGRQPKATVLPEGHITLVTKRWKANRDALLSFVHFRSDDKPPPALSECRRHFETLEHHLFSLLADFYDSMEELDGLLDQANQRAS